MLDARKKIIIGGGVGLLLLVILLVVVLWLIPNTVSDNNIAPGQEVETEVTPAAPAPLPGDQVENSASAGEIDERVVTKQAARMFVERFGTYSNQNNNAHIDLVLPVSTEDMANWLRSERIAQSNEFAGVTTEVLSSSVLTLTEDTAEIAIQVRQVVEQNGTVEIVAKNGTVELVNAGEHIWLVDGLYYE